MIIIYFIAFVLVVGLIILVHELGHFITAKKAGVKCTEFSIGMGPVIKQWVKDETTISLRWIPLGGYVQMIDGNESDLYIDINKPLGLNLDENGNVREIVLDDKISADVTGICKRKELKSIHGEDLEIDLEIDGEIKTFSVLSDASYVLSKSEKQQLVSYEKSFDSKKIWQRFVILVAGATMNFILGFLLCVIASFIEGVPNYDSNVIGSVEEESPIMIAGLKEGDQITGFNCLGDTYEVETWTDVSKQLSKIYKENAYPTITINYTRDGVSYESKEVNPNVYIYNVGITNVGAEKYENLSGLSGVVLGKVGIEYSSDSGEELHSGDVIRAMRIDAWSEESHKYVESEYVEVTNWENIITKLDSVDAAKVYFKFVSRIDDNGSISYSDEKVSKCITTYSNEVLVAQNSPKIQYVLGFSPSYHTDFALCMSNAVSKCGSYFSLVVRTLKVLIAPSNGARTIGLKNMSSVVGIYAMVKNYLQAGPALFLFFVAMLSINIGLMNLLPIPALDGGRIVFVIYEGLTGRKPNKKIEAILTFIVYILLLALFVFITINDIKRLIG